MDIDSGIRYAYGALREKKHYADYALLAMALIVTQVLSIAVLALLRGSAGEILRFAISILAGFVTTYFTFKFLHFRLAAEKLTTAKYSLSLYVSALLAGITAILHTLFFWRQKKLLLLYIPAILGLGGLLFLSSTSSYFGSARGQPSMGGSSLLSVISLELFFGALFALAVAWIYNGVRLSFMVQLALCNPKIELGACSQKSWGLTLHKTLMLFGARLMFNLAALLACFALALALIFAALLGGTAAGPFLGSSVLTGAAVVAALAAFVLCMLVSALWMAAEAYFCAFLYKNVLAGAKPARGKKA